MEKIINYENIRSFAYVNDRVCAKPIKGVVIEFMGLGNGSMFDSDTLAGEFYGKRGILYVIPYSDPWGWMNGRTVKFADEILDVLFEKFGLGESIPVVSSGESMGGQSAIVYCAYAKRVPVACVANCPVCDVVFHYGERNDLPRTYYSALYGENCNLIEALQKISPLHLIGKLPKISYHIFHSGGDKAVNIDRHSKPFYEKMREGGYDITFNVAAGRGHCDIGYNLKKLYADYVVEAIENR